MIGSKFNSKMEAADISCRKHNLPNTNTFLFPSYGIQEIQVEQVSIQIKREWTILNNVYDMPDIPAKFQYLGHYKVFNKVART